MAHLIPINFQQLFGNTAVTSDNTQNAVSTLSWAWSCDLDYDQTRGLLAEQGYYLPQDQWQALQQVLEIQADLDIGPRRNELDT